MTFEGLFLPLQDNRDPSSSIRGIPNVYPDLSKPPVALRNPQFSHLIADKVVLFYKSYIYFSSGFKIKII